MISTQALAEFGFFIMQQPSDQNTQNYKGFALVACNNPAFGYWTEVYDSLGIRKVDLEHKGYCDSKSESIDTVKANIDRVK